MNIILTLFAILFCFQLSLFGQRDTLQKSSDECYKQAQELEKELKYEAAAQMYLKSAETELKYPNPDYQKVWIMYNFAGSLYAKID